MDNNDILSLRETNNPEGEVEKEFLDSQIKPKTEQEIKKEQEKEAERLKN